MQALTHLSTPNQYLLSADSMPGPVSRVFKSSRNEMKEGRERKKRDKVDTHQGSGKMAAEPQAVQEQRVSGGLGGAPAGIHPSELALIHYLSLPLWASVFAELSSAPQVPFWQVILKAL